MVEGAQNTVFFGAWINLAEDPSEIVRMEFDLSPHGGARDLRPVAKAGLHAVPALSLPKNLDSCPHHWIAWLEGSELKFSHLHDAQGTSPVKSIPIPTAEVRIVAPLHTDPTPDSGGRPPGGVLLWLGDRDKQESQLQAFKLTPEGATALARTALPAPKPVWLSSFFRADNRRLALVAQASGGKVSLTEVPWPGTPGAIRKLGEVKGEFVAGGLALDEDDKVHGMLLLRAGPSQPLEQVGFEVDAKGAFTAKPPEKLSPEFRDPVSKAVVRVSAAGLGAALLQDPKGPWSFFSGVTVGPLGEPFKSILTPFDIGFLEGDKPVLIAGGKDLGMRILNPDGTALPESK